MKLFLSLVLSLSLCSVSMAEGKSNGGDDFRKTAAEYQKKANKYAAKENFEKAALYKRLSDIKLDAAAKADKGEWDDIDWSEYHEINKKISEKHAKK